MMTGRSCLAFYSLHHRTFMIVYKSVSNAAVDKPRIEEVDSVCAVFVMLRSNSGRVRLSESSRTHFPPDHRSRKSAF